MYPCVYILNCFPRMLILWADLNFFKNQGFAFPCMTRFLFWQKLDFFFGASISSGKNSAELQTLKWQKSDFVQEKWNFHFFVLYLPQASTTFSKKNTSMKWNHNRSQIKLFLRNLIVVFFVCPSNLKRWKVFRLSRKKKLLLVLNQWSEICLYK